jgi:RimJ/RimL family protein N-acetyltransferase
MIVDYREGSVHGEHVVLRQMTRPDVDQMACWPPYEEPELHWANLRLNSTRERDDYYEHGRSGPTRERFSVFRRDGAVIGTVSLRNIDRADRQGTLGIIMSSDAVGRGLGGEAVRGILHYAFTVMGLDRVILDVAESNERARRCYERIGFTRTGQHLGGDATMYIDMEIHRRQFARIERALAETPGSQPRIDRLEHQC